MSHMDWGIVLLVAAIICSAVIAWAACRIAGQSDEISPRLRRYLAENASSDDAERQASLDGYVWIPTLHNGADTDAA